MPETTVTYKASSDSQAESWRCALEHGVKMAKEYEGIAPERIDEFSMGLSRWLLSSMVLILQQKKMFSVFSATFNHHLDFWKIFIIGQ